MAKKKKVKFDPKRITKVKIKETKHRTQKYKVLIDPYGAAKEYPLNDRYTCRRNAYVGALRNLKAFTIDGYGRPMNTPNTVTSYLNRTWWTPTGEKIVFE